MSTKKSAPKVQAETFESDERKETVRLSAMELAVMSFYVAQSWEKATKDDLECTMNVPATIIESLVKKELLEKDEDGDIVPTKFGVKWALKSTVFGTNFTRLFSKETTKSITVIHKAFFAIVERLVEHHNEKPIFYLDESKQPSKFWQNFAQAVDDLNNCLESEPETEG